MKRFFISYGVLVAVISINHSKRMGNYTYFLYDKIKKIKNRKTLAWLMGRLPAVEVSGQQSFRQLSCACCYPKLQNTFIYIVIVIKFCNKGPTL